LNAQTALNLTSNSLQKTLGRLASGLRINSSADDAAGLAIADGLHANITALTQSARNASDGVGSLQVADGALAQVTALLNRAVTLATEAATGTVSDPQGMLTALWDSGLESRRAWQPLDNLCLDPVGPQFTVEFVVDDPRIAGQGFERGDGRLRCATTLTAYTISPAGR
jgi:hypothetical protein